MKIKHVAISLVLMGCVAAASAGDIGTMEFYNGFDPAKPTAIAAHGWFGSIDYPSTFGRSPSFAENANVIGWEWDAVVFVGITAKARRSGQELAQEFSDFIKMNVPDYDQPIQIVGHSLGTHVVLAAAAELRDIGRNDPDFLTYQADQVTLVDTGFNGEIQVAIDNILDDYLVDLKMDNYFSPSSAGGAGQAYDGPFPNTKVPLAHVTLWNWYFASLDSQSEITRTPGASYGLVGQYGNINVGSIGIRATEGMSTPLDLSDDIYRRVY